MKNQSGLPLSFIGNLIYSDLILLPFTNLPYEYLCYFDETIKAYALFKFKEKTGILGKELEYSNEKDNSKKVQLKNQIPRDLELFELIQESGLNALDIIGEENE